ncbi:MAG: putative ABC transporter permease [Spirochaetaceae bacterium]|jgi:uncharacterized membrane protein|nr:putative ABC transporter permease [Spirochaetaceae bacterium]
MINTPALLVFSMLFLSVTGWVLESAQESITRKKLVSKGFFKGPYVPCHGIGGICIYVLCLPLKERPVMVFLAGMTICTILEYITAVFLEKCFNVKCWDYSTYPHTKWCHYKGRICLTLSLAFGFLSLFVIYLAEPIIMRAARFLGDYILMVDGYLLGVFTADALYCCTKTIKAKRTGEKITGWAVFSMERK